MILQFIIGYAVSSHQFNFTKFFKFSSSLCKVCVYYSSSSSVIGLAHVIGNATLPLYLYAYGCLDGVKMDKVEIKKQLRNEVLILQVKNEMLKMRNELLEMKLQERIKDTDCKVKGLEGQLEVLKQNDKLLVDALLLCEF